MTKHPLFKKLIEALIILLTGFFVFKILADSWGTVAIHITHPNFLDLTIAWLLALIYFFLRSLAWRVLVTNLGGRIPVRSATRVWLISEFSRFIPGNVWSFLSRIYLAKDYDISRKMTVISLFLEIIMMLGSAVIFALLFFLLTPYENKFISPWLFLLAIPCLVFILSPKFLYSTINFVLKKLKRKSIDFSINFYQLFLALVIFSSAWLAYALGSYFAASAFVNVSQLPFIWLLSTFVIAWLVGYVSFITPMGLGVREGVLILALQPVLASGLAGLVAIMTRLWLTLSEISVLLIIFLINIFRKPGVKAWFKKNQIEIYLGLGIVAFVTYFSCFDFLRHYNFVSAYYDLGIMDQVVWNTAHGHIFLLTAPNGLSTVSRFAIHADFLLALLAPFYWIYSSPNTLLLIQALVVDLGAIPLYYLGKDILKNKLLALLIALAYLLCGPLERAVIFDFHAVTLASAFFLFAFYYLYKQKYWWFVIFAILAISTKETMTFLVITLGFYIIFTQKRWKVGLAVVAASAVWFYLLLWHIMPGSRPDESAHFALDYYSKYGSSPGQIVKTILFKPYVWLPDIFNQTDLTYLLTFVAPTGFLALLTPFLILALPEFLINLLSNDPLMHMIGYQYVSAIVPFTFIAFVFGLKRFREFGHRYFPKWSPRGMQMFLVGYLAFFILVSTYILSPLPGMLHADMSGFQTGLENPSYIRNLAKQIPVSAKVSATNKLEPHFSQREFAYYFPEGLDRADYVIAQTGVGKGMAFTMPEKAQTVTDLTKDKRFELIYKDKTVVVYKRK